jgi:hypothetical protein
MSIEREPDETIPLPGIPTAKSSVEEAANGAPENEARFETVKRRSKDSGSKTANRGKEFAKDAPRNEGRQTKSQDDATLEKTAEAALPKARATGSRNSKKRAEVATLAEEQTLTAAEPRHTVKASPTGREQVDNIEAQPSAETKPKRSRRKVPSNSVGQTENASIPIEPTPAPSMPPITNEAIAFLKTPDATAVDLFKLAPASRMFIQYHIANIQRLEADSAIAHRYLLATATKHTPRFEKAVDALVSKLSQDRPTLVEVLDRKTETSQPPVTAAGKRDVYYGPRRPAVTVSLKTPVSRTSKDKVGEPLQENTIEPGTPLEKAQHDAGDPQQPLPNRSTTSFQGSHAALTGRRFVRGVETAFQTVASWLQNKVQKLPSEPAALASTQKKSGPISDRSTIIPDDVARRFLKVNRDYYFPDKTLAFSDRGSKLATRGEHPEVIRSLVDIAIARGWDNITIKGTESFRRSAWLEASRLGLKVAGYHPTALDLADLASRPASNTIEKGAAKDRPNLMPQEGLRLDTREVEASPDILLKASQRTGPAAEQVEPKLAAKARSFDKDKPSFVVKKHPDLAPAYGVINAAKKFAESNLPLEAREEFVGLARRHILNKIMSGEAVIGPKVHMAPARARENTYAVKLHNEKIPNLVKMPGPKARER